MKNICFYETPIGKIAIGSDGESITDFYFNIENIKKSFTKKKLL